MSLTSGLYVVGTPIGNLGDLTQRAALVLAEAEFVVAEDTRRARQLLSHLGLASRGLTCLDANASERQVAEVAHRIQNSGVVALVTDAGMPSVSDPGSALVRSCRELGVPVRVVPGPSAVTAAIAASGLVESGFWFVGFLPRKGGKRRERLTEIARFQDVVVLFEAPHRTEETLADLAQLMPDVPICVARELTKQYEEIAIKSAAEWARESREWLGEVTIVVGAGRATAGTNFDDADLDLLIERRLSRGDSPRDIADELAALLNLSRRTVYQRALGAGGPESPPE